MQKDKELIQQALAGSQLAYERLMERYYDSIYFMILRLVKNMSDAEELSQEAFAKAFSQLEKYDEQYAFSSWLFTIASNLSVDFLRKKKYNEISIDDDELLRDRTVEATQANPEEHFILKQEFKELKHRVESLKEQYRILLELRYFEEYTYEEIAQELDLPMGTVKTQLHRAKTQLMKSFKK